MRHFNFILLVLLSVFVSCSSDRRRTPPEPKKVVDTTTSQNTKEEPKPFNIKLYIENSGSMDGYVDGSSDFKNSIHSYLSDIKSSNIADSIIFNFINDKIIGKGSNLSDFFSNLNSSKDFRKAGGNRKSTDISQVIRMVIDNTKLSDVSILVSDFIFSPEKKDAARYLEEQQIIIKESFSDYIKRFPSCGLMFFQLSANFSGTYYNRENAKTKLVNENRPFYMLVIGDKNALKTIRRSVSETKIKGQGVKNIFLIENNYSTPNYCIKQNSGKFDRDKQNSKHAITNASKGNDGNMTFAVDVDFSDILLPEEYLNNSDNYNISEKDFSVEIVKSPTSGYTHNFKFSSPRVKSTTLKIQLKKSIPGWVDDYNDEEGLDINSAMDKTYGLKTIVDGISEAFFIKNDYYTELTIDINK